MSQRGIPSWLITLGAPLIGVAAGLLIGALLILLAGEDPLEAYAAMMRGAFGGRRQIEETLLKTAPLLLMGLGLTAAFRARVWNIGGEGQFYMGALAGGAIALNFADQWPRALLIAVMILAGVLGGALWAALAGIFKIRRGISEIISTLMLNYIAILFMEYMARGPMQEPGGYLPESAQFAAAARMPTLFGSRIHGGVVIAFLMVPVVYALLWSTPLGFRLRAVGSRSSVARYAGIKVERLIMFALMFSGGMAGLAGIIEVSSLHTRLKGGISGDYGFSGILVALLGRMHPVGVAIAALFFAALTIGAQSMHVLYQLPVTLAGVVQAVVVLCVLAADAIAHNKLQRGQ